MIILWYAAFSLMLSIMVTAPLLRSASTWQEFIGILFAGVVVVHIIGVILSIFPGISDVTVTIPALW